MNISYRITRYFLYFAVIVFVMTNITSSQDNGNGVHFQRPMTLVTQDQIDIVKDRIANSIEPQASEYTRLIQDANNAQSFIPDVPSSIHIEPLDGSTEFHIGYWQNEARSWFFPGLASALAYVYSEDTDYADKAVDILDAWGNEAPALTSVNSRDRDILVGRGFRQLVHIADLLWNYPGWSQQSKDKLIDYLLYIDSRATGYWRLNNIGDTSIHYTLALACLLQDENLLEAMKVRVENWFTTDDPTWGTTAKIVHSSQHSVDHLKQETDRGISGLAYSLRSASSIIMIAELFRLTLGWDIIAIPTETDGATLENAIRNTLQWRMDHDSGIHSYPFYSPPENINNGHYALTVFEYFNSYIDNEDTNLQNWLIDNRPVTTYSFKDPYATLNRGNIPGADIDQFLPEVPILNSPDNNKADISNPAIFIWSNSEKAEYYELQISLSSDFSSILYKNNEIKMISHEVSYLSNNTGYYWRVRGKNSYGTSGWSEIRRFTTDTTFSNTKQKIFLHEGWNIISSFIKPYDKDITNIFVEIETNLSLVSNNFGEVFWPDYDINDIITWDPAEGYQVYMNSSDTLMVLGEQLIPENTPISLSEGWNLKPYILDQPIPAEVAFENIASSLEIVTNNEGEIYWPEYNVNNIGYLQPGEGYKIFVNDASTLFYPSPTSITTKLSDTSVIFAESTVGAEPEVYQLDQINTGSNSILLILSEHFADGDEVGVWTENDMLIGSGGVRNNIAVVTIWGRDTLHESSDFGARDNEPLHLSVWSDSKQMENSIKVESLTCFMRGELPDTKLHYKENSVMIAKVNYSKTTPVNYTLHQNYPNPFNPATTIQYEIPRDESVSLVVYNLLGQKITTLIDNKKRAGRYEVVFKANNLASGVYFYKLTAGNYTEIKRMILTK